MDQEWKAAAEASMKAFGQSRRVEAFTKIGSDISEDPTLTCEEEWRRLRIDAETKIRKVLSLMS